jgi:mannitol-specific phosphotransferase system IIBC component
MLQLPLGNQSGKTHLRDLNVENLTQQIIHTLQHCYACTAGQGSSCGGALL